MNFVRFPPVLAPRACNEERKTEPVPPVLVWRSSLSFLVHLREYLSRNVGFCDIITSGEISQNSVLWKRGASVPKYMLEFLGKFARFDQRCLEGRSDELRPLVSENKGFSCWVSLPAVELLAVLADGP